MSGNSGKKKAFASLDAFETRFVGREAEQDHFRALINAKPGSRLPVQIYLGVSGAGKSSLLLKFGSLAKRAGLAHVHFDLNNGAGPPDVVELVRKLVAGTKIEAPRSFLATLFLANQETEIFQHDPGKLLSADLTEALIASAIDACLGMPSLGGIMVASWRALKDWHKQSRSAINQFLGTDEGRELVLNLRRASDQDIRSELPLLLSQDILDERPRERYACQTIITVDGYDYAVHRSNSEFERDRSVRWIADLVSHFKGEDHGVLIVCCGQSEAEVKCLKDCVQLHHLGGLSREEAKALWKARRLPDKHLEDAMIASADGDDRGCFHALSLGLYGDIVSSSPANIVEAESKDGLTPAEALAYRFLRLQSDEDQLNLRQLALASWWDDDAAAWAFGLHARKNDSIPKLQWLKRFSFVQSLGDDRFTIHGVMRRALVETSEPSDLRRWHQEWVGYWTSRVQNETDDFAAQSWRHRFAVEPDSVVEDWSKRAEQALHEMRSADHEWYVKVAEPFMHHGVPGAEYSPESRARYLGNWANQAQKVLSGDSRDWLGRAVASYRLALEVNRRESAPAAWAATKNNLGSALLTLGRRGDVQALADAVVAFRLALQIYTRESASANWAAIQGNLGNALLALGQRGDDQALEGAVAAYRLALEIYTREVAPAAWAQTQSNLGNALQILGERGDDQALADAVAAFSLALEVRTRDTAPADWATTQSNLGNALRALGERGDDQALANAVAALRLALEVRTREFAPTHWATTQGNLGNALLTIGRRGDDQALKDSTTAYRLALEIFTSEYAPAVWAQTQNNLGSALVTLGQRGEDHALTDAVAAFRLALEVRTRESAPAHWATTQNNLGGALLALGERGDDQALTDAVVAFRLALEVFTRESAPAYWATSQNNLGNALLTLGQRGDDQALADAVAAYCLALEVRTRESAPAAWAETQSNLGNALLTLGQRGDDQVLADAVAAYRLALEVRTRDSAPADWAQTQFNLGLALVEQGQRFRDSGYLDQALHAFTAAEEGYSLAKMHSYAERAMSECNKAQQLLAELEYS